MEKENLYQQLKSQGFLVTKAIHLPADLVKKLPSSHSFPMTATQQEELEKECFTDRDLVMVTFPIPIEAPGEPDLPFPFSVANSEKKVDTPFQSSLYELASAFARIHYYHYIIKLFKKTVLMIQSQSNHPIPKSSIRLFCNSTLPEKLLALLCNVGSVGKNNLLVPEAGSSSLILAGMLFPYGTITQSGEALPVVDIPESALFIPKGFRCGTCNRCQQACPAEALTDSPQPASFHKELCLQYHSHRLGEAPAQTKQSPQPLFYGCSLCQRACPHYKATQEGYDNRERAISSGIPALPKDLYPCDFTHQEESEAITLLKEKIKKTALDRSWIDPKALLRNLREIERKNQ